MNMYFEIISKCFRCKDAEMYNRYVEVEKKLKFDVNKYHTFSCKIYKLTRCYYNMISTVFTHRA